MLYIFSQILVVVYYALGALTYQLHDRKKILIYNLISLFAVGLSYFCLSAYSGVAMTFVGIIRNLIIFTEEKRKDNSDKITKRSIIELGLLITLSFVLSIFTYEGPLSLMSVVATLLYTVSLWQKNTKVYKILGLPVSLAGAIYNAYIKSLLGTIFELVLLTSAFIGFIREQYSKKLVKNNLLFTFNSLLKK